MGKAARIRAQKQQKTNDQRLKLVDRPRDQMIKLENPVAAHYEKFIIGNSQSCERVVEQDAGKGKTVVICGAGPSLRDHADEWLPQADEVWGCNSALVWLYDNGHPVTHGFCIDQTPAMVNEWRSAPPVDYLLASTVHPHLTKHLLGHGRRLTWFHNFVGLKKPPVAYCKCGHDHDQHQPDGGACMKCVAVPCSEYREWVMAYEDWIYHALYPYTMRAGSGLNSVSRAVDVALFMGFDKIVLLGADCAIRVKNPLPAGVVAGSPEHRKWLEEETEMHADGGSAVASGATGVTLGGEIDGVHWETKPDLVITAVFLVKMQEKLGAERLVMVGDTLPNALVGKSDEFLKRLPALTDSDGNPLLPGVNDVPG